MKSANPISRTLFAALGLPSAAVIAMVLGAATPALANQINTGGATGAYFSYFCPPLSDKLRTSEFNYDCALSAGSRENIERVAEDPTQIGYAQADIYLAESEILGGRERFTTLRTDIARECLFIVTKNPEITSFGEVSALAQYVKFVLPPEKSGSAATFELLRQIDPDGLGRAQNVTYADSTDRALDQAMSEPDTFTLFVQFPDANNPRFRKIADNKGVIVPVIDRAILRQVIRGEKIYFAQQTEIEGAKFVRESKEIITACTPMVVFTGASQRLQDEVTRRDHEDLVRTITAYDIDDLRPREGFFTRMLRKTRELSSRSLTKALELTEEAREQAGPLIDQAREKAGALANRAREEGREMLDDAGRLADEARRRGGEILDDAREAGRRAFGDRAETSPDAGAGAQTDEAPRRFDDRGTGGGDDFADEPLETTPRNDRIDGDTDTRREDNPFLQ